MSGQLRRHEQMVGILTIVILQLRPPAATLIKYGCHFVTNDSCPTITKLDACV